MRKRSMIEALLVVAALAVALAGCASPPASSGGTAPAGSTGGTGGAPAPATDAAVSMTGMAFVPAQVEIAVGGTVTWTNDDPVAHTVTGQSWDSGTIDTGATFSKTFDTAGTFPFACTIHPSMTGEVVVK